jgi:hypothetical protein
MTRNRTISALLAATWLLVAAAAAAGTEHEYIGVEKCGTCHSKALYGDQVAKWRASAHAKAYESLASDKALEYAKKKGIKGSPQQAKECLECHVTAYGVAPALIKYDLEQTDGVQCESCHGAGADFRKREIMSDIDQAKANGLVPQTEATCTGCHNDRSPAWDPARFTLPNGKKAGFDFTQAVAKIEHATPKANKGKVIQLEDEEKAKNKKRTVR